MGFYARPAFGNADGGSYCVCTMRKKRCGSVLFTTFVAVKEKIPLTFKRLVATGVHGPSARLVVVSV